MASRRGTNQSFLSNAERAKLLQETTTTTTTTKRRYGRSARTNRQQPLVPASAPPAQPLPSQQQRYTGFSGYSGGAAAVNNNDSNSKDACNVCLNDSDHANLLLCDRCDGHFHTYCLPVPLKYIPKNDWYCDACEHFKYSGTNNINADDDGLEQIVSAQPPLYTERFGEICWAQGGTGYGMWPACVYDPRLTEPKTRLHAKKQVGKKHLVYFFQCYGTPFDLLSTDKLVNWEAGLAEGYYYGRTAKGVGKRRFVRFQEALQAAIIEEGKPIARRLEWSTRSGSGNQSDGGSPGGGQQGGGQPHQEPRFLPSPVMKMAPRQKKKKKKKKRSRSSDNNKDNKKKEKKNKESSNKRARRTLDFGAETANATAAAGRGSGTTNITATNAAAAGQTHRAKTTTASSSSSRRTTTAAAAPSAQPATTTTTTMDVEPSASAAAAAAAQEDQDEDTELFCQVYLTTAKARNQPGTCVGFVVLPSFKVTFADARTVINDTLETEKFPSEWRFVHPSLGPVSIKLESKLGSMMKSLSKGVAGGDSIGTGSLEDPAKITIMADPLSKL